MFKKIIIFFFSLYCYEHNNDNVFPFNKMYYYLLYTKLRYKIGLSNMKQYNKLIIIITFDVDKKKMILKLCFYLNVIHLL